MKQFFVVLALLVASAFATVMEMPDLVDKRDGQVYKTVQIGDRRWMAENLRFKLKGTYCYDKNEANCWHYGRLYTWAAAMRLVDYFNDKSVKEYLAELKKKNKRYHDVCPNGWHVPTNKEWFRLKYFVGRKGRSDGVGLSLKSKDGWERELRMPFGTDEFGFNAKPGGERNFVGSFMELGSAAEFWSSKEYDNSGAYFWRLGYDSRNFESFLDAKETAVSVRCIEDKVYEYKEPPPPPPPVVVAQVVTVQEKKVYTVHIGDQVWMAKNLNEDVPGSFCYADDKAMCEKYGRLYTWAAAMGLSEDYSSKAAKDSIHRNHRGVCPVGWHIPSIFDFERLNAYIQDIDDAIGVGANLKARDVWTETENSLPGENGFGFSALPGGYRLDLMSFTGIDSVVGFWSSSEKDSISSLLWSLHINSDDLLRDSSNKVAAFSVRCLMDPPGVDEIYDSTAIHDSRDDNRYKTVLIGEKRWMAENLRFAAPGSYCYEDKDIRCRSYGRLYPWTVAMRLPEDYLENTIEGAILPEHQGICPAGWHIPTRDEWMDLWKSVLAMKKGNAAGALKSMEGWNRGGAPITDVSGFKALPAGNRFTDGEFVELGSSAYFWESSGGNGEGAAYWNLINSKNELMRAEDFDNLSFSLRCVQNSDAVKAVPADTSAAAAPKDDGVVVDSGIPADSLK
ncbi:MAG: hypothetical protein MJY99_08350 [Fibrobacter sp.]|nr:hypothetical protein [Fibrobacter sp.]